MIRIKDVQLPRVVQSPMANCTDLAFRLIGRSLGMRFAYLEMVSAEALIRNHPETLEMMRTTAEDSPVGAQIVGCEPDAMGEAAAMVESMGYTLVDLNLGCPVPKVTGKGGGSSLLREPQTAEQIFRRVVQSVRRIPVTVKMRLGYSDPSGEEAARIARIAEASGVSAIAVHGRTRAQGYTGAANYEAIGRVKQAVSIPVYGNGDVVDVASARRLLEVSGCDGVMLGRGALGNPWVYRQIEAALNGETVPERPGLAERKATLMRHVDMEIAQHDDPEWAVGPLRRIICWYFREVPGVKPFRDTINRARTVAEMRDLIDAFVPAELAAPSTSVAPVAPVATEG